MKEGCRSTGTDRSQGFAAAPSTHVWIAALEIAIGLNPISFKAKPGPFAEARILS